MTDSNVRELRTHRLRRALDLAEGQAGIVSLPQLYALGVSRAQVQANLRARRWQRVGSQSVCVTTGVLTRDATLWAAVFEAGPRAFLDGASALVAAGLKRFEEESVRVSVPRGARVRRGRGINVRQTRRWRADDVMVMGLPRARPEVAAVRAALWARSDRQAALILSMVVQQGICTAERVGVEMLRVRRDKRRAFIHAVLLDLIGGAQSMGELDFAHECRIRGLPEPTRQVVRRGRNGRYYLDVVWEQWNLVVEIDGIQHTWADHIVDDSLRHNEVALQGAVVLRLPLLGLRVAADEFFEQVERALRAAGCSISA